MEAIHEVLLQRFQSARSGTPTDLTRLTFRRSTAVYGSGGDQVKNLTLNVGPHPHDAVRPDAQRGSNRCPARLALPTHPPIARQRDVPSASPPIIGASRR